MGPFYKDVETGWYYLNSRYYNPEIGRFINADGLIGETGDILGHNMYAYTSNNPVMRADPSGYSWWVIGAAVGAVVGGIAGAAISYYTTGEVDLTYVAVGAVAGALIGAGAGYVADKVIAAKAAAAGGTIVTGLSADGDPTNEVKQTSQTVSSIVDLMKQGEITKNGKNIMTQINETTKILFRIESHPIRPTYIEPVRHVNIEIQALNSANNWVTKWDMHINLDKAGEVIEKIITGPWA